MDPRTDIPARIEQSDVLDRGIGAMAAVADRVAPEGGARDAWQGSWLGHPLHPMLTDLPIGFFSSAWVLDMLPTRRVHLAADLFLAAGLVTAVPTAVSGLADWREMERPQQRVGVVHAAANSVGLVCMARSLWHRVRGRRMRGRVWATAGIGAMSAAGWLGGHLAFGSSARPEAATDERAARSPAVADDFPPTPSVSEPVDSIAVESATSELVSS